MNFFKNLVGSNSNLADIAAKDEAQILEMSPNSINDDFFTNPNNQEELSKLTENQRDAIQLLLDSKNKSIIYEKCYKKKGPKSIVPGSPKGNYMPPVEPLAPQGPLVAPPAQPPAQPMMPMMPQQGGRKKSKKSKKSKKTRKGRKSRKTRKGRKSRKN